MMSKDTAILQQTGVNYLVGIGASAGGLEAIHEFFDNIIPDSGFSFIIVQHLSPDYKSLLPELLSRHTKMKVIEAKNRMEIEPNCIYVMPSRKTISLHKNFIILEDKVAGPAVNTSIDHFFFSLAENKGNKSIAVILSGTGSDGSNGIKAIKDHGGMVIVQDPLSAKFDGMPNSAISTGNVDLILPPELMGEELIEQLKEQPLAERWQVLNDQDANVINDILQYIKRVTGQNFINYKRPTICRRISKRMMRAGFNDIADYQNYLIKNPDEVKKLSKDFLIGVTKFFRDPEAFELLKMQVITPLVIKAMPDQQLKVWDIACSTGEEAYTLAILFSEAIEAHKRHDLQLKIFATDIDPEALEVASKGCYTTMIERELGPERFKKYFVKEGNSVRINPHIRKMVVFAQHDVLKDPPFSKIDLILCRNMLIYMNMDLQKLVMKVIHFALNTTGFLMLGPSENSGVIRESLKEINKKWKIFEALPRTKLFESQTFEIYNDRKSASASFTSKLKNPMAHLAEIFRDTLFEENNIAALYVERDLEIKQATGNFKKFLRLPDGNLNFNISKMVHPDLSIPLIAGIRKAIKDNERVYLNGIRVRNIQEMTSVSAIIKPFISQTEYEQSFVFVILKEDARIEAKLAEVADFTAEPGKIIQDLEKELTDTKNNLQAVVEELEASNEELQSMNEEMISANEELQSTNEELQSLNEELHTVNTEHQTKIKELIELNDDLNNYLNNSPNGQIAIDKDLFIRRFSPEITKQIKLIPSDIGRSLTDIATNLVGIDLIKQIKKVIKNGVAITDNVQTENGHHYRMVISPYIRQDKSFDGVVISFNDITTLQNLNVLIDSVLNSTGNGIIALKSIRNKQNKIIDFEYRSINYAAAAMLRKSPGEVVGKKMLEIDPASEQLFEEYINVVEKNKNFETEYYTAQIDGWNRITATKLEDGLVVSSVDITEKKKEELLRSKDFEYLKNTTRQLSLSNTELEQSNTDLMRFASIVSHDLKEPLRKIQTFGNILQVKFPGQFNSSDFNYLDKIIKSSRRMQALIDDLLDLSRLSNKEIAFVETDLMVIFKKILEDLELQIQEKNAVINIPEEVPKIFCIPAQISQLFQNLFSNALKFNSDKQPKIDLISRVLSNSETKKYNISKKNFIALDVIDNGIGFEKEEREKIFNVFHRLYSHSTYPGTGLGLAICKKVAENHNGYIEADSEKGGGSKFTVLLPIHPDRIHTNKEKKEDEIKFI